MDSVSPTNQKKMPFHRDEWDEQADRLIEWAKCSPELQRILVKALTRPENYLEQPRIEMKRLLAAYKVADVACTTIWDRTGASASHSYEDLADRWRKVSELLLTRIRDKLILWPPFTARHVRDLRYVLEKLRLCLA